MTFSKILSKTVVLPLIIVMLLAGAGCKSKKKAMEAAAAAEKARVDQEAALKKAREEEERRKQEEAAELDRQRQEREAEALKSEPYSRLNEYFNSIASSNNSSSANGAIQEALGMFASEDTPVLIVISESGGIKDYDRPTTIRAYLNYLKDVKKSPNRIGKLHFDNANKIVEVELIKGR